MKEIKFPNTKKVEVNGIEFNVKPFLSYTDMMTIVSQAKEIDNVIDRKYLVDVLLARFCTDIAILDTEEVAYELVDLYRANGIFDAIYENIQKSDIDLLKKALAELDAPATQLKAIRNDFITLFSEIKDYVGKIDLNAIQSGLAEDLNKLSTLDEFKEVKKLIE